MLPETTFIPLEFLRPAWLLGIIVVFLFSLLRYRSTKNNQGQTLIAPHLSKNLVSAPDKSNAGQFAFTALAVIACISLSGPSWRQLELPVYEMEKAQVVVLDLSYSMYATDAKPSRLTQAKYKAIDLIKKWSEGEKGLITYAGDAFTISPLTVDGNSIINHIPHLSPEIMPVSGSRADLALEKAIELMTNAGYKQGHIVFLSDDIDKQTAEKMIKELKGSDWVVSILAMATPKGAPIKLPDGSLLKDENGSIVVPKLKGKPFYDITRASGGMYLTFTNTAEDVDKLAQHFSVKEARKNTSQQSAKNEMVIDDGYWLAFLLLPLFLLLFRKGVFYVLLISVSLQLSSPKVEASVWKNNQQNAFQAYQDKDYQKAVELYEDPLNKGAAYYQNKQYKEALASFTQAAAETPENADAFYNQGNSYAQLKEIDKAIRSYQKALTLRPDFQQAQDNKKLLEDLKKQQQEQKDKQQSSEQQESDQQQSDQQSSEQQDSEQQQSEQQSSDQQQSEQQSSDQQQSEQQQSDQQQSEQQQSEQQDSEQQDSEQQSEQQSSEQQNSEQQNSEQQSSEQQDSEQLEKEAQEQPAQTEQETEQETEQKDQQQLNALQESGEVNQELEQLPNWLKNMPDDPSLLLKNKMRLEYRKRALSQPVKQENNGAIW
ncbi:vWA domain-containing protein [Psychromonas aquimarina]|uniref:vWA domain-containing protein n=1 Tax=Psychromonas aquimarina TaxID=444919 RepID=UPI000418342F|nr:tetratricopeptide repeat protein [Psychromonas aquimarina]